MAPDLLAGRNLLAQVYASNGSPEDAMLERVQSLRRMGQEKEAREVESAYRVSGEPGMIRWYLQRGLPKAERAMREPEGGNRAWSMALLYARLGEVNDALRWLERAASQRGGFVMYVKIDPWLGAPWASCHRLFWLANGPCVL